MRSRSLITIWPTIHFYSKLTISLLTTVSKTGPRWTRASMVLDQGDGIITHYIDFCYIYLYRPIISDLLSNIIIICQYLGYVGLYTYIYLRIP